MSKAESNRNICFITAVRTQALFIKFYFAWRSTWPPPKMIRVKAMPNIHLVGKGEVLLDPTGGDLPGEGQRHDASVLHPAQHS